MNTSTTVINHCEVCGNTSLKPALNLGLHPLCDDLIPIGEARTSKEYPIEILFCEECLTAHQKYQVHKHELFPDTYHYRSRFTKDVLNGMKMLVRSTIHKFGDIKGKLVLDIGCNDGSLLDFFAENGARTLGIEPTMACKDAKERGHEAYHEYLGISLCEEIIKKHGQPDFITFTNVFAHIEDLNAVLDSLRVLMKPETILIVENHYLGAVFDRVQFDTFYHEHPRTYSYNSFVKIAESLGSHILSIDFPKRYGGNIQVFIGQDSRLAAKLSPEHEQMLRQERETFADNFIQLTQQVEIWKQSKLQFLNDIVSRFGPLPAKAFPGRAAILIKLLRLDVGLIPVVFEKPGSMKIGHYLPGTRIPIFSDDVMYEHISPDSPMLNLAWHIPGEISAYLKQRGHKGEIINILDPSDF